MAKSNYHLLPLLAALLIFAVAESQSYSKTLPPSYPKLNREKLTHFHFYFHEVVSGRNPTSVKVADAGVITNSSSTFFGLVAVIDDALTEGPDRKSKLVGRAQGMYTSASQSENALLMNLNIVFTNGGMYDGSTLSLFGRNNILSDLREVPIVGGSGVFRFAKGYALAKTYSFNLTSGDAVVEYDVYALHYY